MTSAALDVAARRGVEHLVHLVVLVAQVENDTLNNTGMLRASTGISECFPSAVQFVLTMSSVLGAVTALSTYP